ncbi:MAG: hypothetical protein K1Y36_12180 [Blastocatellia bacterium]|nr:hypothetical protein [Blastocatellia bacterium]
MEEPKPKPAPTKPQPFVILSESPVQRCEVCHQSDCLNLETGVCSRCQHLDVTALEQQRSEADGRHVNQSVAENRDTESEPYEALAMAEGGKGLGGILAFLLGIRFLLWVWEQAKTGEYTLAGFALVFIVLSCLFLGYGWATSHSQDTDK